MGLQCAARRRAGRLFTGLIEGGVRWVMGGVVGGNSNRCGGQPKMFANAAGFALMGRGKGGGWEMGVN